MKKDLVICHTPLQMEIVYSLIKSGIISNFDFVVIGNNTEQLKYYFDKINEFSDNGIFIKETKRFTYLTNTLKLILNFGFKSYKTIFLANVEKCYIHSMLSNCYFETINTFDDGTANIVKDSMLFRNFVMNSKQKTFSKLLRTKFNKDDIINLSSKHYTLYIDKENIISNTEEVKLSLYDCKTIGNGNAVVLLGSVYDYISTKPDRLIKSLNYMFSEKFYYIPHPRDNHNHFDNGVLIDGVEIAEVKILNLLSVYETVTVYGFNSSAQLNLNNNDRINIKCFVGDLLDINKVDLGLNEIKVYGQSNCSIS
ncbi:CMP-N-acetylneuraminate-beta-galactosamide-alpha-2,3-sialyltransferase [Photobacterium damselae subsp. piscicida]|uniref:CMP-N-acetylneuraminate-beta-galactosamide-alpha-2,3-sialyltransferase n=1 Tax=Photobacterium damsela subsp. piscicida TaxID=38294 RepID=A0A1V1VDC1_PHODP|nr:glycosyltransferase family 52 [Photobacterium damselae]MBE8127289.1 hypothetical protein [Photobacterium damselae subsp. piscicida]MDP2515312.1 glycosyltransferase family 52 [Photobacterium damselae subsp. piscicida]MDP2531364.1 glycosyltransferase family 52 [Photobacterium damselae subsp. piscicida]MDP2543747.1 glycosyltransferase family 52 [Photobacterium damselae subsp. piscicida]MDP2556719.1 glycosyltransferase family 52 [Photobacterium damselae subsp. piscicida]